MYFNYTHKTLTQIKIGIIIVRNFNYKIIQLFKFQSNGNTKYGRYDEQSPFTVPYNSNINPFSMPEAPNLNPFYQQFILIYIF